MNETALNAVISAKEELETVKLYTERMNEAQTEEAQELYRKIIAEELKHVEQFFMLYVSLTGIEPEEDHA